ncbi:hypothetical protein OAR04_03665 [Flavobacteriales bacterium]|nr:hypothetical protein [Flavobacteriales bacterium]
MNYTCFFLYFLGGLIFLSCSAMAITKDCRTKLINIEKDNSEILGLFTLLIGLPMIILHNIWEDSITIVVSVFGWLIVVKGFFRLLNIQSINKLRNQTKYKTEKHTLFSVYFGIFLGITFITLAYFQ